jgi:hypothetical protein
MDTMRRTILTTFAAAAISSAISADPGRAQQAAPPPPVEVRALDLVKAMGAKLAQAKTLQFETRSTYEVPGPNDTRVYFTTAAAVSFQRPDKLRVISLGDGPPSAFYATGQEIVAYTPGLRLLAVAAAPGAIEAALKTAYDKGGLYFPFADVLLSDPAKTILDGIKTAYLAGQSKLVGDITTDIVVLAGDDVRAQVWIGAEDNLPRKMIVTFPKAPNAPRYETEFDAWQLDRSFHPNEFRVDWAGKARRIEFAPSNASRS